ncbi:MAG TPA: hypothetical protein DCM87_06715 [Planctomycetes bacterium]|nr:hypothetical protein [Planctomycetota bacterium]
MNGSGAAFVVSAALALHALTPCASVGAGETARQWEPVEWRYENPSWEGNPFDLIAKAAFRHTRDGDTIDTQLFHAGGAMWVLRFTGTKPGRWEFTTACGDSNLDGLKGEVTIEPNPGAAGFMTAFGSKWGRLGRDEAFVPQYVSYCSPADYHDKAGKIDADIETWFEEHGFNGFHTFVGMAWFDIGKGSGNYGDIPSGDPNPDPRTFEALELLIGKAHRAGGAVHIWAWGDEQRKMTPFRWGVNGRVDRRLQRYICARLGPLPAWSMGYGFDLQEWAGREHLRLWHEHMHANMGWFHFLGARAPDLEQIYDGLDYSSYQQHRPTYDTYVEAIERRHPGKPSFLEDRFRVRVNVYPEKDYTPDMTRRGLWDSTMAGGAGNIWAYLIDPPADGSSAVYPNKEQIRTYSRFWKNRFRKEMVRNNRRTDGVCLEVPGRFCVFYTQDAEELRMDLAGLQGSLRAVAVDARAEYREIPLSDLKAESGQVFKAPRRSDWAVAVGDPHVQGGR